MAHLSPPTWTRVHSTKVVADSTAMRQVMHRWVMEPELVIPPVASSELLAVDKVSSSACHREVWQCVYRRCLRSKRPDKDAPLVERICLRVLKPQHAGDAWQTRAEFEPEIKPDMNTDGLPFYYPKVRAFAFVLESNETIDSLEIGAQTINSAENMAEASTPENGSRSPLHDDNTLQEKATLWVEYLPLSPSNSHVATDSSAQVWQQLLNKLRKWCENTMQGYQKRSRHDQLVSKDIYLAEYARVKARHAHYWIEHWPEKTDPGKFVFEDIAIATWLLCLWEEEHRLGRGKRRPTFIDLGCGNGLLTHLLIMEGSVGMGIDLANRAIWEMYGEQTQLVTCALQPNQLRFNVDSNEHSTDTEQCPWTSLGTVDWIIGNHADELVPWIPIIAARSGYTPKFVIIPCCFYTLDGRRNLPKLPGQSRYASYQRYLENIITTCGYKIEQDQLRIPSTKNIAYVGRWRTFDKQDENKIATVEANIDQLARQGDTFKVRMTDRAKDELRREKKRARLQDKETHLT